MDISTAITIASVVATVLTGVYSVIIIYLVLPKNKKIEEIEKEYSKIETKFQSKITEIESKLYDRIGQMEKNLLEEINTMAKVQLESINNLHNIYLTKEEFSHRVENMINKHKETCHKMHGVEK